MTTTGAPIAALFLMGVVVASSGTCAQTYGKRVFATQSSCDLAGWLTGDKCKNSYSNALAELDEKAPRFSSRAECEQSFKHCMIAGFNGKRAEFEPSLEGFEVTARATGEIWTLPIVEGDGAALGLQPRSISHPSGVSRSRQAEAQARWTQLLKDRAAAAAAVANTPGSSPESDANWDIPTVAPPPDPAAAERRRKEIRDAPTVY
jgi:hypothetical protein